MKYPIVFLLSCVAVLAGCVQEPPAQLAPMEIQGLQTRSYDEPQSVVFASVVSVFQDLGYTIKSADAGTGFISAESATNSTVDIFFGNTLAKQTAATAFVETIGDKSAVRISFVEYNRVSGSYGQTSRSDTPLYDAELYQRAFNRIEDAMFVRSS